MGFEQIRVFLGLNVSNFTKGLEKAKASLAKESQGLSKIGLGGLGNLSKASVFAGAAAGVAAIAKGLMSAGERAQRLRDMAQETGLALDAGTRNAAAIGDRMESAGNVAKKAWTWYADLFEEGLQAFGAGKARDTSAGRDAAQRGRVADTSRERAIEDAQLAARQAVLLADHKIVTMNIEIQELMSRQLETKREIEKASDTDAGRAMAAKLTQEMNQRNLDIIAKTGAVQAAQLARSREIAESERALWQTERERMEINSSHVQRQKAAELEALNLERLKADYAGDTVKQNELQNQANKIRNDMLAKEKAFKLAILEIDMAAAAAATGIMLNNDLATVELLTQQATIHRGIAAALKDEVERAQMIAQAQAKENQALQIKRAIQSRILANERSLADVRREFMALGENVFATDVSRAKLARAAADDAVRLAKLEEDKEVRAQKLLDAQGKMNAAIAAELKTRTSISSLADIAEKGGRTSGATLARRAQKLYGEAETLEARGNFADADRRRARAQEIEERVLAPRRARLQSGIRGSDTAAGRDSSTYFASMKSDLAKIEAHLAKVTSA